MPELDDVDEEMAAEMARSIAAGTDHIWMPIEFVKDDIPPPKAPLPAAGRMNGHRQVRLDLPVLRDAV